MYMESKLHHSWIMKAILKNRVLVSDVQEVWIHMQQNNKFNMKQVYTKMKDYGSEQVIWKSMFYGNVARPQALMTLWLACHGKLPTKDNMHRFGLIQNKLCCFCSNIETPDHLFSYCVKLKNIWKKVFTWTQVTHELKIWHEEKKWILMHSKGNM